MFHYDINSLRDALLAIIKDNISAESFQWLRAHEADDNESTFKGNFVQMPRRVGKTKIICSKAQLKQVNQIRPCFTIDEWSVDKLCRVYLLIARDSRDKDSYFKVVTVLFDAAEMNELAALYAALPVLPYPELWTKRCAEGIRSNIGIVLEAIMYQNPYPAEQLDEAAWNQMVLKAFFTEKQINRIVGLDKRANKELARILIDYAKERHAAGRDVDAMLWYLAGKFVDEPVLNAMKQGSF